jgi:hypothetical protein
LDLRKRYDVGYLASDALIRPFEKVTGGFPPEQGAPASALMFGSIVVHVAALAEGGEVLGPVVRRVMIAVASGQDYPCGAHASENIIGSDRQTDEASGSVTPGAFLPIPPAAVPEVEDSLPVRTGANLAPAIRALEADHGRELRPIDGVEEAVLAPDRHPGQS